MTLKEKFKLGRKFLKEGSITQADRMFDMCIVHLSKETLKELRRLTEWILTFGRLEFGLQ